jgi:hypothetical protein
MKCKDCAKYPFCIKINNPSDVACNEGVKRKLEKEVK